MGIESQFYKEKQLNRKKKLRELEKELPPYVIPYLDDKELTSQINTVIAYTYDLLTFFRFLKEKNPLLKNTAVKDIPIEILEQLNFSDINDYQKFLSLNDEGEYHNNEERAIARRMAPLRGFFAHGCLNHYLCNDPTLGAAKRKKMPKKDIIRLDRDEVHEIINVVSKTNLTTSEHQRKSCERTQLRDTAIITLLLNTGIRVSECAGLDLDDMNYHDNSIRIVRKGGSEAHLYFNDDVLMAISNYVENERPLLLGPDSDEKALFISQKKNRLSVRAIEAMVKKFAIQAAPGKKISPHKMRSTYGTELYRDTGDIRLVSDVLGHKDINTTAKHYAAMEEDHRRMAARVELYKKDHDK